MKNNLMRFLTQMWQTFLSIIKILLQSKWKITLPHSFKNEEELLILANGPSLNHTIENPEKFVNTKTLLVVNFFAVSPIFDKIHPELYLIADPLFWIVPEKCIELCKTLADKVTWSMSFFIPVQACKSKNKEWQSILSGNPNIHVHTYNTTPIEGFPCFCNVVFRKGWGVPRPHNVLIPSIAIGLRLPFRKIYLAGADHSWLSEITVTNDNVVLMNKKYFYDQNKSQPVVALQENLKSAPLYVILYHMYMAFKSYFVLESYSCRLGKEIINITPNSYIDAFKKMDI